MSFPNRPVAFILASTNHGTMIVNRNDYCVVNNQQAYGVGFDILNSSSFSHDEVNVALRLLDHRRQHFGDGVIAIDGGANIGVHSVEWARHMFSWGYVLAYEAQEAIYYALAGNLALNNCLNVQARLAALGEKCGDLAIPRPNYFSSASFGSLELQKSKNNEYIGQDISYAREHCTTVPMLNIDSIGLQRLDFLKIDVEGMEVEVLRGAAKTVAKFRPIILAETIKADRAEVISFFVEHDYTIYSMGMNTLAIHSKDPTAKYVSEQNGVFSIS